jgi:AcrR family transcriptional regulator
VGLLTANALLNAAETEFADSGIEDASLRAIMRAADADAGAVHYHFRTREALVGAVLDRILVPLNARRLELLDEAEIASDSRLDLDVLMEALVRPDVEAACELHARSRGRARLIGAIYIRPAKFVKERVEDHFRPVAERFLPHLICSLPDVPPDLLSWRVRWCVFGMVGALMSDELAPFVLDSEELIARLVAVSVAGVSAGASV